MIEVRAMAGLGQLFEPNIILDLHKITRISPNISSGVISPEGVICKILGGGVPLRLS